MLKIKIKLEEISLKIKRNFDGRNSQTDEPFYFEFYLKEDNKLIVMGETQKFTQENQALNIIYDMYVKKLQIREKNVLLKIFLLINQKGKQTQTRKYLGYIQLQLRNYIYEKDIYPLKLEFIVPIKKCKDPQAYLKLSLEINEILKFEKILVRTQESHQINQIDQNDSQLTQKQIEEEFTNQQLTECKSQLQSLQTRSLKYQNQISHLKEQNSDLSKEIVERKQAIKISSRITEDKLDLLIKKNIKIEREFVKAKEQISDIVNMINEYGRLDIVQEISNLLVE